MKRLTLLTAALAAGMTSFAADAQESPVALAAASAKAAVAQEPVENTSAVGSAPAAPALTPIHVGDRGSFGLFSAPAGSNGAAAGQVDQVTTASVAKQGSEEKAVESPPEKAAAKKEEPKAVAREQQKPAREKAAKKTEVKTADAPVPQQRPELVATARKASLLAGSEAGSTESDKALIAGAKETAKVKAVALGKGSKGKYHEIVARYASAYGVPVSLAHAVISIESNYRPGATGSAGEIGLMQIKPSTARMMGFSGSAKELYSPETNIKYGLKYLGKARELGGGTTCGTILKYNAGHGAKRMNPVSAAYCSKVKRQLGSA